MSLCAKGALCVYVCLCVCFCVRRRCIVCVCVFVCGSVRGGQCLENHAAISLAYLCYSSLSLLVLPAPFPRLLPSPPTLPFPRLSSLLSLAAACKIELVRCVRRAGGMYGGGGGVTFCDPLPTSPSLPSAYNLCLPSLPPLRSTAGGVAWKS